MKLKKKNWPTMYKSQCPVVKACNQKKCMCIPELNHGLTMTKSVHVILCRMCIDPP